MLGSLIFLLLAPPLMFVFGLALVMLFTVATVIYGIKSLVCEFTALFKTEKPKSNLEKYFDNELKIRNSCNANKVEKDAE